MALFACIAGCCNARAPLDEDSDSDLSNWDPVSPNSLETPPKKRREPASEEVTLGAVSQSNDAAKKDGRNVDGGPVEGNTEMNSRSDGG